LRSDAGGDDEQQHDDGGHRVGRDEEAHQLACEDFVFELFGEEGVVGEAAAFEDLFAVLFPVALQVGEVDGFVDQRVAEVGEEEAGGQRSHEAQAEPASDELRHGPEQGGCADEVHGRDECGELVRGPEGAGEAEDSEESERDDAPGGAEDVLAVADPAGEDEEGGDAAQQVEGDGRGGAGAAGGFGAERFAGLAGEVGEGDACDGQGEGEDEGGLGEALDGACLLGCGRGWRAGLRHRATTWGAQRRNGRARLRPSRVSRRRVPRLARRLALPNCRSPFLRW
jgi:hypothetical protein